MCIHIDIIFIYLNVSRIMKQITCQNLFLMGIRNCCRRRQDP